MVEITNRFKVCVKRYSEDETGSQFWNGEFESEVYAISGNEKRFLVYDPEYGFEWIDFNHLIPQCGGNEETPLVPAVELVD
jgi:hypothetical protein